MELDQDIYISFRKKVRQFVEREITPNASAWEQAATFPAGLLQACAREGFIGVSLPSEVGGRGESFWHEVVLVEELAQGGALGWALSVMVHNNLVTPLLAQLGTDEQKETILKAALRGEYYLALAATEPRTGSDVFATTTTGTFRDGNYHISGEKKYITNGSVAKYLIVLVRTGEQRGLGAVSLIIVPGDASGVERRALKTAGFKTGDTAIITLRDCKVPIGNVLGEHGRGLLYLLRAFQRERLIGAIALNEIARFVVTKTIKEMQMRERFGAQLSKKQVIRHRLVSLAAQTEALRQFTYVTCATYATGKSADQATLMLKILSYEHSQRVIEECIHLHGGEGFLEDHWLLHLYRDSQAFTIAGGTSEIMKEMLAQNMRI